MLNVVDSGDALVGSQEDPAAATRKD
jgi:hypothetical protein